MKVVKILLPVFLLMFATPAIASGFEVERPWIREAPPGMKMLAGYMTLENKKKNSINLVGASSTDFESIQIHHTIIKDDVVTMTQQQSVRIPPYSTIKFEPKGLHLMLINPRRELRAGDKVKITLKFSNYRKMKVVFPVRKGGHVSHHRN